MEARTDVQSDAPVVEVASGRAPVVARQPTSVARTIGRYLIGAVFAYCAVNSAIEALDEARDIFTHAPEPLPSIMLFQIGVSLTSVLSAIGVWRRSSWAPRAVIAWGILGATFVALLQPLLGLPRAALPGLLGGAVLLLALTAGVLKFLALDPRNAE